MAQNARGIETYIRQHLVFGWWCLFGFVALGLVLDSFHAFKFGWYLGVGNESRRLMGTLAHAHGTLFGGVNLALAFTLQRTEGAVLGACRFASPCLMSASLMIPLGFLLAGIFPLQGEPGAAIFLVPVGGLMLFLAVGRIALAIQQEKVSTHDSKKPAKQNKGKKKQSP